MNDLMSKINNPWFLHLYIELSEILPSDIALLWISTLDFPLYSFSLFIPLVLSRFSNVYIWYHKKGNVFPEWQSRTMCTVSGV